MNNLNSCTFCQPSFLFQTHMAGALFEKYSSSVSFNYLRQVDMLVNDQSSQVQAIFRQSHFLSDDCQYLRRQYQLHEFAGKIESLSEYYKFNRDLPLCYDSGLVRILHKYHDRLRQLDFKKVKAALKRQQGISLSSQHNQSSLPGSNEEIKSRYSTVLQQLEADSKNQSNILGNICDRISQAFGQVKMDSAFKGNFQEGCRKFQQFVLKEQKDKKKNVCRVDRKRGQGHNQLWNQQSGDHQIRYNKDNKQNLMKNGMNFLKVQPRKNLKKKSPQKTTANETISRQEKSRKADRLTFKIFPTSKQQQPTKQTMNGLISLKPITTTKTIDQICKSSFNHDKYMSNHSKKTVPFVDQKRSKSRVRMSSKGKSIYFPKQSREEKLVIETERIHREESKKSVRKNSTLKRPSESRGRQPTVQSRKNLALAHPLRVINSICKSKQSKQRTLSKSKSKAQLSKQNSRQSIKIKQPISRSISSFQDSHNKSTAANRLPSNINRLLNKKLALFGNI